MNLEDIFHQINGMAEAVAATYGVSVWLVWILWLVPSWFLLHMAGILACIYCMQFTTWLSDKADATDKRKSR